MASYGKQDNEKNKTTQPLQETLRPYNISGGHALA
jgi:hypothetical protein